MALSNARNRGYNALPLTASSRETFGSRFGAIMTMIGVAVGLGNVWRFPYMVGTFGGAAFVLFYILIAVVIGVPGLMAEFALGRHTRRGTVGAFEAGGFPAGRQVGWFFFVIVVAATGYYAAVVGWVLYHAIGQAAQAIGVPFDAAAILPPDHGFVAKSFVLQLVCTAAVMLACALVMIKGLRAGIERASTIIMPALFVILVILTVRALTLPGAGEGVRWFILKFRWADLTPAVMMASIGHLVFSLSLGGTFMVVYGSYLSDTENVARPAIWTVIGDTGTSMLAGFAIMPAVFALHMAPGQGPGLLFSTLPQVFAALPLGSLFGLLFFAGLFGAGYLSNVAAVEVLVAGLTDNTRLNRRSAVWLTSLAGFVIAIPPTLNNAIFVPWDLTFGSGMQTLGALVAVLTVGWCMDRGAALRALSAEGFRPVPYWLFLWIRFGIPAIILTVGIWWLLTSVIGTVQAV
jgi:neurotransmitter:Na+ symporter, NSS family